MKRFISMLAVVCIIAMSAVSAFAYTPDDNGRYTIVYEGLTAGEMYGMVAVKNGTISESNIVYIDQATADENGTITFTSFGPMGADPSDANYEVSTVYIGGTGLEGATAIGTLEAATTPEPDVIPVTGVTLSETAKTLEINGTVQLAATVTPDNATDASVTWTSSDNTVATVEDGLVTALKAGTATITAKAGDQEATCVITVNEAASTVMKGDVNGSGTITARDGSLILMVAAGQEVANFNADAADVNASGTITARDGSLVLMVAAGQDVELK